MKKDLYIMRHGETLFNVQNKIQGWCDSPLTENGIAQTKVMAEKIKDIAFDHYYSSTAERCCDTLELVCGDVPYTRLKGLRERYFGSLEGEHQYLQIEFAYFDQLAQIYGGETTQQVVDRVLSTITSMMEQPDHNCVFAVSHGGALVCLCRHLFAKESRRLPNSAILHLSYQNGQFQIVEIIKPE